MYMYCTFSHVCTQTWHTLAPKLWYILSSDLAGGLQSLPDQRKARARVPQTISDGDGWLGPGLRQLNATAAALELAKTVGIWDPPGEVLEASWAAGGAATGPQHQRCSEGLVWGLQRVAFLPSVRIILEGYQAKTSDGAWRSMINYCFWGVLTYCICSGLQQTSTKRFDVFLGKWKGDVTLRGDRQRWRDRCWGQEGQETLSDAWTFSMNCW